MFIGLFTVSLFMSVQRQVVLATLHWRSDGEVLHMRIMRKLRFILHIGLTHGPVRFLG